jgi:hypothetical protein
VEHRSMRIDRSYGTVASWGGSLPMTSDLDRREDTIELVRLLQKIAEVLCRDSLLFPATIELDGWFDIETQHPTGAPATILSIECVEEIAIVCTQTLERGPKDKLGVREISVHGTGRVEDGFIEHTEDDLIWISGILTGAYSIWIHTQSDVWMTHTLEGTPQPTLYAHNAPRLERALARICTELGIILEGERVTDFALVEGFRVKNFTDGNGEIIVPERLSDPRGPAIP